MGCLPFAWLPLPQQWLLRTLLMSRLPRLTLLLLLPLLRLVSMLLLPQFKDQLYTWMTQLMSLLPRLTLLLLLLLPRLVSMPLLPPSQLRLSLPQLFQPMLLHSTLVSTTVSTHMLLDTMAATTHMLVMVLIHMPLPHTPMLLLQLPRKNKGIQSFVHISGKYQNYENIVFIEDFQQLVHQKSVMCYVGNCAR